MKNLPLYTTLSLCICFTATAVGQNYLGTDFRAMFMRNLELSFNGIPQFEFNIYAPTGADITITYGMPGDPYFQQQTGTVLPNAQFTFAFTDQILEQENYNTAETRSFHITSTNPIRVYGFHSRQFFSEGTAVLPGPACGAEYWVTTYQETSNAESQVSILAYSDNTNITIIPSVTTPAGPAGVPFNVLLQTGETYTLAALGTDLTNTHIFSADSIPFAIFAGHRRTIVGGCTADSHLYEQLVPVDAWGTGFALIPPAQSGGEQVRITSATDSTEIYEGCDELLYTLNAGQSITFLNSLPRLIRSNHPVQVITFTRGASCTIYETGDPNMRQILPLEKAITEVKLKTGFSFSSIFLGAFLEFFHLVTNTENTGNLTLNGNPVAWTPFDTQPEISFARVDADDIESLTTISSSTPFWAEQVALGAFDAITMSLGSDTIMALPPLGSTQVSLGPDFSLCPGTTTTLQVPANLIPTWQDGSQANTFIVSEPGTYYATVLGECGTASDTVQVGLFEPAAVSLDTLFFACTGQSATISTVPLEGYNYIWSDGTTGPQLTTATEGTYILTATSPDGCQASAQTTFSNLPLPNVSIQGDSFLCEDSLAVLIASPTDGDILWSTGQSAPSINIFEPGSYTLAITDTNGCTDSTSVNIPRILLPIIFATDTTVCAGERATLHATSPNGDILWLDFLPGEIPIVPPGTYTVEATNTCGPTRTTVTVFEDPCTCEATIPNIFSPNGDGRNDVFQPLFDCDPTGFSMAIFDRWGVETYTTTSTSAPWTGTTPDGTPFTEGIYYYLIQYLNPLLQRPAPITYTGWLTLVR
jgi:gliding motility-associated-like protein